MNTETMHPAEAAAELVATLELAMEIVASYAASNEGDFRGNHASRVLARMTDQVERAKAAGIRPL